MFLQVGRKQRQETFMVRNNKSQNVFDFHVGGADRMMMYGIAVSPHGDHFRLTKLRQNVRSMYNLYTLFFVRADSDCATLIWLAPLLYIILANL